MAKKLVATYDSIRAFYNEKSNYWLALSEFIDNSVSSYKNGNSDNPIDGLRIDIDIDYSDNKNKKITITDNANGMDKDRLEDAMQPNDTEGKGIGDYNQYGIGMKLGVFWFGKDGFFYTKKKDEKTYFIDFKTTTKKLSEAVEVEAIETNENIFSDFGSGTKIIISNIYKNRKINITELKKIKDALGWRYSRLIQEGLKIHLSYNIGDERSKKNEDCFIKQFENIPFNFNKFLVYKKEKKNEILLDKIIKIKAAIQKEIIELKEIESMGDQSKRKDRLKIYFNTIYFDSKYANSRIKEILDDEDIDDFLDLRIEAYEKFIKNENLVFEKSIHINGKDTNIKFGILGGDFQENKKGFSKEKYNGLTTYHKDRAINHGPNNEQCTNLMFTKLKDPTHVWMYGEINLTNIEEPDKNKSKFDWSWSDDENYIEGGQSSEISLQNQTEVFYKSLRGILKYILDLSENTSNEKNEKSTSDELKAIKDDVCNHLPTITSSINEDEDGNNFFKFFIYEIEYEARIYEDNKLGDDLIKIERNDNEKIITVWFNNDHSFWKPLLKNGETNIKGKIIYPIIVIMTISNEVSIRNDMYGEDFITTFNKIASYYKKNS